MNVIYQVAAIVGRRVKKGKVEYRVRWKGFPPEEDTWEPSSALRETCFPLIRIFNTEHKKRREHWGDSSCVEMTSSRSPSPSQKASPSVCSSDQLSLVSAPNCSPRSASPLPPHQQQQQSASPPGATTRPVKATVVKRSPVKAASAPCPGSSSPVGLGGRKKVLVVFNATSCDSPPPTEARKRENFPLVKAASSAASANATPKAVIQRESVKTVDITSTDHHQFRGIYNAASQSAPTPPPKPKVGRPPLSEAEKELRRKQKEERKKPHKRKGVMPVLAAKEPKKRGRKPKVKPAGVAEAGEADKKQRIMTSGKKTKEYLRLKSKSLRKVDKKIGFKRVFEPPFHARQLDAAMNSDARNIPVMIIYALDRIKKMKRKSDVENIFDVVSRMESDLVDQRPLIEHTVAAMEGEGHLLRWEGNGNCSFRVSNKGIESLRIDNSDNYLLIHDKNKKLTPVKGGSANFEKPLSANAVKKKTGKDEGKKMFIKKEGGLGRKRKLASSSDTMKDAVDPILPPPVVKRRKMVEESSEVSASSSSGPPTDASYQAKETKLNSNHSNASSASSSQSLVNKACNIIENIQNKSKTNTHLYLVGKHVILIPPSSNPGDLSMAKEMQNLPHKRFISNGGTANGSSNGASVQAENGPSGNGAYPIERRISVRQTESAFRYKEIMVKRQDNVVEIVLQSTIGLMRNVFTMTTFQELTTAIQSAVYDSECRLVVLTGSDMVFSHGVDLSYVATNRRGSGVDPSVRLADAMRNFLLTLVNFPKPVVAVLNGPAIGLGAAMLPLCDIVYASDKAVIQLPYCYLGQTPEGGSSFTFPKVVGEALAADMFMSGRRLTAKEASDRGLISDVFWPSKLMLQTLARCRRIAQCPAKSLESTKCIIRSQQRDRLVYAIESECSMLAECWESLECKQKIQEFLNSSLDSVL